MTDQALAEELGVGQGAIANYRQRRGIAPAVRPGPSWLTPEIEARLGTQSDASLAEELGHETPYGVRNARRRRGIAGYARRPTWLTEDVQARLGTLPDRELASELGVHWRTLAAARQRLGIRAWQHRIQDRQLPGYLLEELQTAPDDELVERWAVSHSHIAELREELREELEVPQRPQGPPPQSSVDLEAKALEVLIDELTMNPPLMARELVEKLGWERRSVDRRLREAQRAGWVECRGKRWGLT